MNDLVKLNRRIALYWLGILDADQNTYLRHTPVCIARFVHHSAELARVLERSKLNHHNSPPVAKLNRQYLRFARLAAKDVAAGRLEMLVRLGLGLDQTDALGKLTNEALNKLAFGWDGPIIRFDSHAFIRGAALHARAAQYHAVAHVAARLAA